MPLHPAVAHLGLVMSLARNVKDDNISSGNRLPVGTEGGSGSGHRLSMLPATLYRKRAERLNARPGRDG